MDNDERKWGKDLQITIGNETLHFPIKSPKEILKTEFDEIILATMVGYEDNLKQLEDYKIPKHKIKHIHLWKKLIPRIQFLESFAKECKIKNLDGNVAELGVFQGEFAKKINEFFPNRTLYLFDTFEGFDERDLKSETNDVKENGIGHLNDTSIEIVMNKMLYPKNVIIKKGWFPESAVGLDNEKFCFVNIDTDLYEPILAGLEFFYPKIVKGGVILIHDYFNKGYPGVRQAVSEFCEKYNLNSFPIGDDISIAIQKV
ncbi:TylF/MycF/NovP-related O-methyltransferase [Campylobacter coli]|uniref:TylF/MycF/NovP-related O-methyltransferase n=1 Tax=Campylobacter coli TaxID=195 RepID=UPI001281724B|nr:TylF/MycF/NovP-related O-methyltransferase [Campylobacter coli]EAH4913677.1 methyltransferase [Campylobacter coli]EAH7354920.1 methyltransferase [Campylobacter coli]EAI7197239.1 methyltransferase [Campylobacter coli]EAJ6689391.1 methyltransferase [Campylobacter coli]EAJ6694378.1 methyltransferase [Campylobacter coli]